MDRLPVGRRTFVGAALGLAAGLGAAKAAAGDRPSLAAKPPKGFTPLSIPGKVVRVEKPNSMQANALWPRQEAATAMLERAMAELTGKSDVGEAFAKLVHKDDKVAIKPNGIAGRKGATMAANKELVLAIVKGLVAAGVPATNITIYEQYGSFLKGTRVVDNKLELDADFPKGITTGIHENKDATMDGMMVGGVETKYVRFFTEATCVIDVTQIKDHSICGYTGTMKNITHGSIINPHHFHAHRASPQIAQLYAQDVVKSRVRLHITDAFKVMYDEGPLDNNPKKRVVFESVYASTDPVAMDVVGWALVEKLRKENGLPTLKEAQREPSYIKIAGELGLGIFDKNKITLREVKI